MNQLKLIFFFLLAVILSACSILGSNSNSSQIVGEWEWFRSTGGFTGETVTPDSAGASSQRIIFQSNLNFSYFHADTLVASGKYSINEKEGVTIISYDTDKNYFFDQRVQFEGSDTLILADECADCYINYYNRDE